jgi:dTDP-4-dehydrorhamnose 3,5-epimerase
MNVLQTTRRFDCVPLAIRGVMAVKRQHVGDSRGFLSRLFCADELATAGWVWPVAQINHSYTAQAGTVRGMHYQHPPHADAKLVTCLQGRVWDVAVDLRADSPTFLQWCAHELSADNQTALLIPPGCAHGFQALSQDVELLYLHSAPYVPQLDAGLNPNDLRLGIRWPVPVGVISEKDATRPLLANGFRGLQT